MGRTKQQILASLDAFERAYIECALWSSTYSLSAEAEDNGIPLDEDYETEDLTRQSLLKVKADCAGFRALAAGELASIDASDERNGHDFWLTRNRHGAGFWDRGYPTSVGKALTDKAHSFGEVWPYVWRNKVYF